MATAAANKRLTREYKAITANPPPYISAHPSESNILEWHYLLTGPPATPYEGGQYWGTLIFPPEYPYKPPAIRMATPSGRFQPSARLCLSISDFHPKSFNPAWEVATILIGLLSFMTGEEMTTGSVAAGERERKVLAQASRWWNSTGGGSAAGRDAEGRVVSASVGAAAAVARGGRKGAVGDAGAKFRKEWPEEDAANWKWIEEMRIDPVTGLAAKEAVAAAVAGGEEEGGEGEGAALLRRRVPAVLGSGGAQAGAAVVVARGESWLRRHRLIVGFAVIVGYVLLARAFE